MQVVSIPATSNENHPVAAIIEESTGSILTLYNFLDVYVGPRRLYHLGCPLIRGTNHT